MIAAALGLLVLTGGLPVATDTRALIYGEDSRLDVYQVGEPRLRDLARRSVVLIEAPFSPEPLRSRLDLCAGERFAEQPALAGCSGVLLDGERVLTASHCVREEQCRGLRVIAGFAMFEADTFGPIAERECVEVLVRDEEQDVAVLRIDRLVEELAPISTGDRVAFGERVIAVGHPLGLPAKIDPDGRAESSSSEGMFFAALDVYEGSSGSGVYNEELQLLGIATRGAGDFELDPDALCLRSRTSTTGREVVVFAARALDQLKASQDSGCTCTEGHRSAGALAVSLLFFVGLVLRCTARSF